jgi:hypothetical protein
MVDVCPNHQLSPHEHPEVLFRMEPSHYHLNFYLCFCELPCLSGTLLAWTILGDFGLEVALPHYLCPHQLFSHIAFLHIICSIMLPSFTSVGLSYYLSNHQLLWHVTFFHVSCPAHYLPPHQLSCHFTFFHINCPATLPSCISVVLSHYLPLHWFHPSLFRCIRKIVRAAVSFVMSGCPSLFQSAWNNLAPTGWNFMKFGFWRIKKNLSRKFKHN